MISSTTMKMMKSTNTAKKQPFTKWYELDVNNIKIKRKDTRFKIEYNGAPLMLTVPTVFSTGINIPTFDSARKPMPQMQLFFENRDCEDVNDQTKGFLKKHDEIVGHLEKLIAKEGMDLSFKKFDPLARKYKKDKDKKLILENGKKIPYARSIYAKLAGYVKQATGEMNMWAKLYDCHTRERIDYTFLIGKKCNVHPYLSYEDASIFGDNVFLQVKVQRAMVEITDEDNDEDMFKDEDNDLLDKIMSSSKEERTMEKMGDSDNESDKSDLSILS